MQLLGGRDGDGPLLLFLGATSGTEGPCRRQTPDSKQTLALPSWGSDLSS